MVFSEVSVPSHTVHGLGRTSRRSRVRTETWAGPVDEVRDVGKGRSGKGSYLEVQREEYFDSRTAEEPRVWCLPDGVVGRRVDVEIVVSMRSTFRPQPLRRWLHPFLSVRTSHVIIPHRERDPVDTGRVRRQNSSPSTPEVRPQRLPVVQEGRRGFHRGGPGN